MKKKDFYKFYKMLRGTDYNLQKITDYVFSCKFFLKETQYILWGYFTNFSNFSNKGFDKDSNGVLDFSEFIIAYRLDEMFFFWNYSKTE